MRVNEADRILIGVTAQKWMATDITPIGATLRNFFSLFLFYSEAEFTSHAEQHEAFYISFAALAADYISGCANTCKFLNDLAINLGDSQRKIKDIVYTSLFCLSGWHWDFRWLFSLILNCTDRAFDSIKQFKTVELPKKWINKSAARTHVWSLAIWFARVL